MYVCRFPGEPTNAATMASEDIAKLAETLAKTQVAGGQLSFKGKSLKLNTADDAKDVIKEIEDFDGLEALRLEGNTVGVEAARVIAKALEKKSELKRCHWSDMFTGRLRSEIPPALISLGEGLITAGAQLVELDLSDNAFGPDGVRGFEALLKSSACFTLHELKLNNCGMGIGGGKILAAALTECHRKSSAQGKPLALKVFVAGRNRLENDGATALAEAFGIIGTLEEVHMPQNGINHPGVTALAQAFAINPLLRVINLNDNTFTEKGAVAMAKTLRALRQVEVINFGDCLVRSKGAVAIADAIRGGLPKLKELNLSFGEIKREAALSVAEAVADKTELEKLDLNGNMLGEEGCEQLQEVLEGFNMAAVLASLSDDEGEDDEDEDDEEEEEEEEEGEEEMVPAPQRVTDLELGMYALLGIFCLAILIFLVNGVVFVLRYQRKEPPDGAIDPASPQPHNWVWLGTDQEELSRQLDRQSPGPPKGEGGCPCESGGGGEALTLAQAQAPAGGTTSSSGTLARKEAGGRRKRVEFVTFAPAPPAQLPEEPVGAPAVQSILVAGEEDIRWVCEDMGLKDPEELRSYMERIRGSS